MISYTKLANKAVDESVNPLDNNLDYYYYTGYAAGFFASCKTNCTDNNACSAYFTVDEFVLCFLYGQDALNISNQISAPDGYNLFIKSYNWEFFK